MNYYDILFARKMAGGQGEITTEGLSVTENGTYTAPEGKAYTPVVVNVPTPENAYLLKDIQNVPSDIVTFSDGANLPMPSLKVGIEPIQEGSGDPSPTNVRPISGWDECKVTVADDVENPTVSNTYTIDLDGTRYGGNVDLVSGVLTVDRIEIIYDGSSDEEWAINNNCHCTYVANIKQSTTQSATNFITIANEYKPVGVKYRDDIAEGGIAKTIGENNQIAIKDTNYSTNDSWREFLASKPLQVVYELTTPQTIQLTPTMVKSLLDTNNIWADTGDVLEGSYFKEL